MKIWQSFNLNKRKRIKKIFNLSAIFIGIIFTFFAYTSNIKIDEGTPELYSALDFLFWAFLIIILLVLTPTVYINIVDHIITKEETKHIRKSKLDKKLYVFDYINYTFMTIFMILCIFPIIYVLVGSFNQGADYIKGRVYIIPRVFTFENYRVVLENSQLWSGYFVTISRTVIGTLTALIFTSTVAYAMSRPNLKYKKVLYWLNIFTMFFSGGLIPYLLIIRIIGLYDSFLVYIIPALYSVYNMIIISTFFIKIDSHIDLNRGDAARDDDEVITKNIIISSNYYFNDPSVVFLSIY